jgi:hypothetical protein
MDRLKLEKKKDCLDHDRKRTSAAGEPGRLQVNSRVGSFEFITMKLSGASV